MAIDLGTIVEVNELDYIAKARSSLSKLALERIEELPPKTLQMINDALNNVESLRTKNHIDVHKIDLEMIAANNIERMLLSDEAFNLLQYLPRHMKLQLNVLRFTPYKIKKAVRDQFYEHSLRAELLLHITKTSDRLDVLFNLKEEDIFKFYEHRLTNNKRRGKRYNDRDNRRCPLHLYVKTVLTRHISIDHIEEIKTWGKSDASRKTNTDPIFNKRVLNPNKSENLFIMPTWLNLKKTKFIRSQVNVNDPNQCGKMFLNLVPKEGPKEGVWVYPSKKAFAVREERPKCECGKRSSRKNRQRYTIY